MTGEPIAVVTERRDVAVLDPGDQTFVYFGHASCGTFAAKSLNGVVLASAELCDGDSWVVRGPGHASVGHDDSRPTPHAEGAGCSMCTALQPTADQHRRN